MVCHTEKESYSHGDDTRSMLKEKSIPNTFWTKEVYITVYNLNKCPTKVVQGKTIIEP